MVSKPKWTYETRFQILDGDLRQDPKVASQAVLLAFTPGVRLGPPAGWPWWPPRWSITVGPRSTAYGAWLRSNRS